MKDIELQALVALVQHEAAATQLHAVVTSIFGKEMCAPPRFSAARRTLESALRRRGVLPFEEPVPETTDDIPFG